MGKARQSKLWDSIRADTGWDGTKEEFEAVLGPIKNFEFIQANERAARVLMVQRERARHGKGKKAKTGAPAA